MQSNGNLRLPAGSERSLGSRFRLAAPAVMGKALGTPTRRYALAFHTSLSHQARTLLPRHCREQGFGANSPKHDLRSDVSEPLCSVPGESASEHACRGLALGYGAFRPETGAWNASSSWPGTWPDGWRRRARAALGGSASRAMPGPPSPGPGGAAAAAAGRRAGGARSRSPRSSKSLTLRQPQP
jgi:hypothetical protein